MNLITAGRFETANEGPPTVMRGVHLIHVAQHLAHGHPLQRQHGITRAGCAPALW